jgi:hypothetical protein
MSNLLIRLLSTRGESTGRSPGILLVKTFRTCRSDLQDCEIHCRGSELDGLQFKSYYWCKWWWRVGDYESAVARSLDIPIASYRDAIWPEIDNPPSDLPYYWNGLSHPDRIAHELISDVVKYALEQLLHPSTEHIECPIADSFPRNSEKKIHSSGCISLAELGFPVLTIGVHDLYKFKSSPILTGSAWNVFEDKPLKPGWIGISDLNMLSSTTSNVSLSLSFNVSFSHQPRLEITYLRSYEGFTDVRVSIEGCSQRIDSQDNGRLTGLWDRHYSLPFSTVWVTELILLPPVSQSQEFRLFDRNCILTNGPKVLTMTILKTGKFKLLSLSTC